MTAGPYSAKTRIKFSESTLRVISDNSTSILMRYIGPRIEAIGLFFLNPLFGLQHLSVYL